MFSSTAWYENLRNQYRPEIIRVLFIAESPPDPGETEKRFFYAPELSQHDNLYRGIIEAIYGDTAVFNPKTEMLKRFCKDGYWVIDAVGRPINHLSNAERKSAIKAAVHWLVSRVRELAPDRGVIICHKGVYNEVAHKLKAANITILHEVALPFPLYGGKEEFKAGVRKALGIAA